MKFNTVLVLLAFLASCNPAADKPEVKQPASVLQGTWELIAATSTEKDSTFSTFNPKTRMIKIISPTHFAFFLHDLSMGKDTATAAFSSGGGTYTLRDSAYTENLEYCNFREWEGHTFDFTVTVKNDTLTQRGLEKIEKLGIERIITETYRRVLQ